MSHFSCSLTRNITSHSMENVAFHSLLRWKMIIIQILATPLMHFLFKRLGEWKGYRRTYQRRGFLQLLHCRSFSSLSCWVWADACAPPLSCSPTRVRLNDRAWHHVCLSWQSKAGKWQLYKDGHKEESGQWLNGAAAIPGEETPSIIYMVCFAFDEARLEILMHLIMKFGELFHPK